MDQTHIKVQRVWKCVWRTVRKPGKTIDVRLTAGRCFEQAMGANGAADKRAIGKSG